MKSSLCCFARVFILLLASAISRDASALTGFDQDFDAVKERSRVSKKPVLALFTGSDWCSWCVKLEKEVFSQKEFLDYATNTWELAVIDFPMKKKLPAEIAKRNAAIKKRYSVRGFPTVLLLDTRGNVTVEIGYVKGGAGRWLDEINHRIKVKPLIEKFLGESKKKVEAFINSAGEKMMKLSSSLMSKATERKATLLKMKEASSQLLKNVNALLSEVNSLKVPEEIIEERKSILRRLEGEKYNLQFVAEMNVEEALAALEKIKETEKQDKGGNVGSSATVTVPAPGAGHVETDYYEKVAMPFYDRHIVGTFAAPKGMSPDTAADVSAVRRGLARWLATGRDEFPTSHEFELARSLWNRKCHDAAVAMVYVRSLDPDGRYWKGASSLNRAIDRHDFAAEPVLGFLLRNYLCRAEQYRLKRVKTNPKKPYMEALRKINLHSVTNAVAVFKGADPRIPERLDAMMRLPDLFVENLGHKYLMHIHAADKAMESAHEARGSGQANDVSEEGWKGWASGNEFAYSNLLAAVELRPEDAIAKMKLAVLAGKSCGSYGNAYDLCSGAISNSLDVSAEHISDFLHFRTSRWGGSTRFLQDFIMQAATNVDVRSTFSYRAAAEAFRSLLVAESDCTLQSNAVERLVNDGMAESLYSMFDAYIKAPESPFMPSRDVFKAMGMSLAIQLKDWPKVRKYWSGIKPRSLTMDDAFWINKTCNPAFDNVNNANLFELLVRSPKAGEYLAAEEAFATGRIDEAYKLYGMLSKVKEPFQAAKYLVSRRHYALRRAVQERDGGWVDIMPSDAGGEAIHFWGMTTSGADGRARSNDNGKSYYRVTAPIPGVGSEFEGTVHFENRKKNQKVWNIGWGLARQYSGYCADNNSWAFPYMAFQRDEKGDRYSIQVSRKGDDDKDIDKKTKKRFWDIGWAIESEVCKGELERKDSHSFKMKVGKENLVIFIDGKEVYSCPTEELINNEEMANRIQPDGSVLPVWKVFENTSFSDYRYRRIP